MPRCALFPTLGILLGLAILEAQPAAPRPRVNGIDHVALRVGEAAPARRFYGELLGLRPATGGSSEQLAFAVGQSQKIVLKPGLRSGLDERLDHVAFATPDLAALTAHLRARGVELLQPPDRCTPSAVQVRDPDGHTVEFVEAPWPPSAPPSETGLLTTRLLHAGLIVREEARAHNFSRDVLGFQEIWRGGRPEGTTRWINMRVPDGTSYVEYMLSDSTPTRKELGVLHHLCLRVDDMQDAWEEIGRRSVRLQLPLPGPPQIGVNGRYQLNLYDPDGTRVELMEPFTVR